MQPGNRLLTSVDPLYFPILSLTLCTFNDTFKQTLVAIVLLYLRTRGNLQYCLRSELLLDESDFEDDDLVSKDSNRIERLNVSVFKKEPIYSL